MNKNLRLFNLLVVIALFLSACNLPASDTTQNLASTAAAQTVQALLSATPAIPVVAASATPAAVPTLTPIPLPINTSTPAPTATSNCNVAQFITDVTIPDGTLMTPGQAFTKRWRIKNIGSCTWNGFSLVFDSGDSMKGPATQAIAALGPGQEVDLEANLTAPATPGTYRGYWRIVTNSAVLVPIVNGSQGKSFYVDIKVQNSVTATSTTSAFAVTSVTYVVDVWNDATHTNCPSITTDITTNGAGTVGYHWVRNDGNGTSGTLIFSAAGTQSVTFDWPLPSSAAPAPDEWMGIYIDAPNHQDFGHVVMPPCTTP